MLSLLIPRRCSLVIAVLLGVSCSGGGSGSRWAGTYKSKAGVELLRVRSLGGATWVSIPMGTGFGGSTWFMVRAVEKTFPDKAAKSGEVLTLVPEGTGDDATRAAFALFEKPKEDGEGGEPFGDHGLLREGSPTLVAKGVPEGGTSPEPVPSELLGAFSRSEGGAIEIVSVQDGAGLSVAMRSGDSREMERRWGATLVLEEEAMRLVPDTTVAQMFELSQDDARGSSALTRASSNAGGATVLFKIRDGVKIRGSEFPGGVGLCEKDSMLTGSTFAPLFRVQ